MAAAAVALGSVQSATASPAAASADRVIAFDQPTGEIRGYCPATNLTVIGQDGTHRRMLVKTGGGVPPGPRTGHGSFSSG